MQELYGGRTAGDLLSSFSRLFTIFLQRNGFTCGISDLLLNAKAEKRRGELIAQAERKATSASAEYVGLDVRDIQDINNDEVGNPPPPPPPSIHSGETSKVCLDRSVASPAMTNEKVNRSHVLQVFGLQECRPRVIRVNRVV